MYSSLIAIGSPAILGRCATVSLIVGHLFCLFLGEDASAYVLLYKTKPLA